MSDRSEKKPVEEDHPLDLNFVPTWARQEPGENPYVRFEAKHERHDFRRGRGDRDSRPPRRDDVRRGSGRPPAVGGPPRPAQGRPAPSRPERPRREEQPAHQAPGQPQDRPAVHHQRRHDAPQRPRPVHLPLHVSFLPERQGLGVIVRKIHQAARAYSLPDVAELFLSKPIYHLVKVEASGSGDAPMLDLFQCRVCGMVFLEKEEATRHALAQHMDHFFVSEEVETEPPSGQFTCIARCTLNGELIAPPNHHSYAEKVHAMHAERYAHMDFEAFKSRIETLHDQELIEQWKQESTRHRAFRIKDAEDTKPMKEAEARTYFLQQLAGDVVRHGHRFVMPAAIARAMEEGPLRNYISDQWLRETRFPITMIHALRPALRHMKLHLFKGSEKETFVTAVKPSPINPEQAVPAISEALHFMETHPGCKREDLIAHLADGAKLDDEAARPVVNTLKWLIEKGHVIEFHNGLLSVPMSRSRALPPESKPRKADAVEPSGETAESPAAERKPEPMAAEPSGETAESPAAERKPEPMAAEPSGETAESLADEGKPEPMAAEPSVKTAEPVADAVEPSATERQPEPETAEPEEAGVEPSPETVDTKD